MIAQLKYGSGVPFNRLERMEELMGIPLPAATQWEVVADAAELIKPVRDELIRQAAQGEVLHNEDTGMRVLRLVREPSDQRTRVFTSGIVAAGAGRKIALYFTGRQHAGGNLAEMLELAPELSAPIQMCDALSRNVPKLSEGVEILVANCLAHGRRQFVEVAQSFPQECRYVLEALGRVYYHNAQARQQHLSAQERLWFQQQHSAPVMEELHGWLQAQLAQKKTEPNSAHTAKGPAGQPALRFGAPAPGRPDGGSAASLRQRADWRGDRSNASDYTCAYGNKICRDGGMDTKGKIVSGKVASNQVRISVLIPNDLSNCYYNGMIMSPDSIRGGYSCYQGGGLLEEGNWDVHRAGGD